MLFDHDNRHALAASEDPAGLWNTLIPARERAALAAAFAADVCLRPELDWILDGLQPRVRARFIREFAFALSGPSPPATPAGAVLPALARCLPIDQGRVWR